MNELGGGGVTKRGNEALEIASCSQNEELFFTCLL